MNRRATTLLTTLGVALGGLVVTASPAAAYSASIGLLDTSTPGHVEGTVTSDGSVVRIRVANAGDVTDSILYDLPDTDASDTFSFNLRTWGLASATVVVSTCEADWSGCTDVASSAPFATNDPLPAIDWEEETVPVYDYTVAAWDGYGGYLFVDGTDVASQRLAGDGTPTTITFPSEGDKTVRVWRCNDPHQAICRELASRAVRVRLSPPLITSVTSTGTSIYPVRDHYRDYVNLRSSPMWHSGPGNEGYDQRIEIWDATRTTKLQSIAVSYQEATASVFTWHGRRPDGTLYPAGTYATRAVYADPSERQSTAWGPNITIVRKHLESRVFRKTVSAAGSKVAQYVGRCSRLRSPSRHGWTGSLGLYSNTRCRDGATASTVRTTHRISLPAAVEYSNPVINVYGGSPRLNTSDVARLLVRTDAGTWEWLTEAQSRVQWYGGMASRDAIAKDRTVTWALRVRGGRHWDAKSFAVRVPYSVLVND